MPRGDLEVVRTPSDGHKLHEPRGVVEGRVATGREQVRQPIDVCTVFWVVPRGRRYINRYRLGLGYAFIRPKIKDALNHKIGKLYKTSLPLRNISGGCNLYQSRDRSTNEIAPFSMDWQRFSFLIQIEFC